MNCRLLAKIAAAAALAVGVGAMAYGFGFVAVQPQMLDKNVFVVEAPTPVAVTPVAAVGAVVAAPAVVVPLAELLTKADVDAGQKTAKVCAACHSFGKGEAAKMGPNLYGIVGAKHAHMAGFAYSEGMKALADKAWTVDDLDAFLTNPRTAVAGTKMSFAGIKNDGERANVIAWLRSLADAPEALPTK